MSDIEWVPNEGKHTVDESTQIINDLVNSEHGDVCNFVIVSIIHRPDGTHGIEVTSPCIPDYPMTLRLLLKGVGILHQVQDGN